VASAVILCVDDEDIPRTLREMVLATQGYTVLPAVSAAEALELLDRHHVDLVLTDQMMPEVVGTELAKKLRAGRPRLPIIIVSGVNEIPDDAIFADRFVSKVDGPEALFRNIAEVLAQYSQFKTQDGSGLDTTVAASPGAGPAIQSMQPFSGPQEPL
jgi:CheY-like chemotaxis protein